MTDRDNPTPTQQAAVLFVAALAENVDQNRGILATNGTPETRARVAEVVRERFFGDTPDDAFLDAAEGYARSLNAGQDARLSRAELVRLVALARRAAR